MSSQMLLSNTGWPRADNVIISRWAAAKAASSLLHCQRKYPQNVWHKPESPAGPSAIPVKCCKSLGDAGLCRCCIVTENSISSDTLYTLPWEYFCPFYPLQLNSLSFGWQTPNSIISRQIFSSSRSGWHFQTLAVYTTINSSPEFSGGCLSFLGHAEAFGVTINWSRWRSTLP